MREILSLMESMKKTLILTYFAINTCVNNVNMNMLKIVKTVNEYWQLTASDGGVGVGGDGEGAKNVIHCKM